MNIETEKTLIKSKIDQIEDIKLLESIKHLLYPVQSEKIELELKPMSVEEYRRMIEESEEDVRQGKVISIENLKEESNHW